MPITEAQMNTADMERLAYDGHVCAECGGRLVVAGGAKEYGGYILRCGNDIKHTGITRHDIKNEAEVAEIRRVRKMDSTALTTMDKTTMLGRIEQARFPQQLTKQDKDLLAVAAISYGFDPLMKEISIFQGQPYISIDGRYRKAQETGLLDGVSTRPATKTEKVDWDIPDGDYFFRAEVRVKGASCPFVGWGRVFAGETMGGKGFKPVEKNPQRMAEKRAEAQALRKAFHIPLPSVEDIGAPEENGKTDYIEGDIVPPAKPANPPPDAPGRATVATAEPVQEKAQGDDKAGRFDKAWLDETLKLAHWKPGTLQTWIKNTLKENVSGTIYEMVATLPADKQEKLAEQLQGLRETAGQP